MISLIREERQFQVFALLSGISFLTVGVAFVIVPELLLQLINKLSLSVAPSLDEIPISVEKFWLSMTFSMMMTISILCFITWQNVRKNKGYMIPVLVSKAASSFSALGFFIFSDKYFAYLVIFIVDGFIFWLTLIFYIRANRAFFETQTAYLRKKPVAPKNTGPAKVVARRGEDKFELLDKVIEEAGFFEVLEKRFNGVGKSREDFKVVIKPNFMFAHHKKDNSSYTEPKLVEALIDKIAEKGYPNITIVEAQSAYGNYYKNREVLKVARYLGYSTDKNYRIVDLTEENGSV